MRPWKPMLKALALSAVTALSLATGARPVTALPPAVRVPGTVLDTLRAGEDMALVYNGSTGVASTGHLGADGTFFHLRTFGLDRTWTHIVPTTQGRVLFYSAGTGALATGQFQADGSYQDLKSYPRAELAHNVVATSDGVLLFYLAHYDGRGYKGLAWTGRINANGDYVRLSETYLFDFWTHIVPSHSGLVFFYNVYTGAAATGRITPDGGFRDLHSYQHFDAWTQIVATTEGTLLFYNTTTGDAGTGQLDADGNYSDLRFFHLLPATRIVPTSNGRLLFFSASGVLAARIDPQGSLTGGQRVRGLSAGFPVVFVR